MTIRERTLPRERLGYRDLSPCERTAPPREPLTSSDPPAIARTFYQCHPLSPLVIGPPDTSPTLSSTLLAAASLFSCAPPTFPYICPIIAAAIKDASPAILPSSRPTIPWIYYASRPRVPPPHVIPGADPLVMRPRVSSSR